MWQNNDKLCVVWR